jgi:RimJ/RimL family protein N-acetyltransferase
MSDLISFKRLTGKPEEMEALNELLKIVPDYTRRCRGEEQGPLSPAELLGFMPKGVEVDNKILYGIYFNHRMVGCVDLIKAYPDARTVLVNLLLIAEDVQGAGLGSESFKEIEKEIRTMEGIERIRIGILRSNDFVQNFWRKMGFRKTGDSQAFESGSLKTKMFFMEKGLKSFPKSNNNGPKRGKKHNNNGPRNNHRQHDRHERSAPQAEVSEPVENTETKAAPSESQETLES